jgi:hypothetical protein
VPHEWLLADAVLLSPGGHLGLVNALIWLTLWAAGTVLAAEDRWLVEPHGATRSVRSKSTDSPRR